MKKTYLILLASLFLLASCGDSEKTNNSNNGTVNGSDLENIGANDMNEFSFVPYGLNFSILLPEVQSKTGAGIEPEVTHEDGDYLWYLDIGNHFHLVIEDYGKETNKVAIEKERLNDLSNIFTYEYLTDEPKNIMYKRSLQEGAGGKATYHCYGETTVDGYTIVLRSSDDGGHKPVIKDMMTTIKSAKELSKNS